MKKKDYILLRDINWFGREINAGTVYRQTSADYYQPIINSARCPSLQIDFYTVKNNPIYFLEIKK